VDKAIETLITYSCETLRSKEMNTALSQLLGNHFYQSIASIKILEQIILALIQVKTVNLVKLAITLEGTDNQVSLYRKLQRFFSSFNLAYTSLAKLLVKLARIEGDKWLLAIDRTNWKFGKLSINILVLSICHKGIAIRMRLAKPELTFKIIPE
jgi:predicted ferric reductase